jgi:hypothetical protein
VVYYRKSSRGYEKLGRKPRHCLVKNQKKKQSANAIVSRCLRGRIEEENIGYRPKTNGKIPSMSQVIGHDCSANTLLRRQEWRFQMKSER